MQLDCLGLCSYTFRKKRKKRELELTIKKRNTVTRQKNLKITYMTSPWDYESDTAAESDTDGTHLACGMMASEDNLHKFDKTTVMRVEKENLMMNVRKKKKEEDIPTKIPNPTYCMRLPVSTKVSALDFAPLFVVRRRPSKIKPLILVFLSRVFAKFVGINLDMNRVVGYKVIGVKGVAKFQGVQVGDLLVEVNGIEIRGQMDLRTLFIGKDVDSDGKPALNVFRFIRLPVIEKLGLKRLSKIFPVSPPPPAPACTGAAEKEPTPFPLLAASPFRARSRSLLLSGCQRGDARGTHKGHGS